MVIVEASLNTAFKSVKLYLGGDLEMASSKQLSRLGK